MSKNNNNTQAAPATTAEVSQSAPVKESEADANLLAAMEAEERAAAAIARAEAAEAAAKAAEQRAEALVRDLRARESAESAIQAAAAVRRQGVEVSVDEGRHQRYIRCTALKDMPIAKVGDETYRFARGQKVEVLYAHFADLERDGWVVAGGR